MNPFKTLFKIAKRGNRLEKSLLRNHLVAIALLILATLGIYSVQNKMLTAQKEIALLVNTAGKQRMLSQKLFRILFENRDNLDNASLDSAKKIYETIYSNHYILLNKLLKEKSSIVYKDPIISNMFFDDYGIDILLKNFGVSFVEFIESPKKDVKNLLLKDGQILLDKFEIIVEVYQTISERRVEDLIKLEKMLTFSMILLIILEGYFIFRPALSSVYKENLLLKKHKLNLERKVKKEVAKRQEQEAILIQKTKLAEMGEMLSNIAHQWKQPLNILSLIAGGIKEDIQNGELEEIDSDIESIYEQIRFMSKTIDNFRDFYQPDRKTTRFNLANAIRSVEQIIKLELARNNIDLIIKSNEEIFIDGYENEFQQIILNLITNAKDAIAKSKKDRGFIEFKLTRSDDEITILIEDSGAGIDDETVDKIFNPYFTTKDEGTGIGLYMIQTILERHFGGTIAPVKNQNRGALFKITIQSDLPSIH